MSLSITPNQTFNFPEGYYSSSNISYSYTGSNSLTWTSVGLPVGLSLNNNTIQGTASVLGSRYSYIRVTDSVTSASTCIPINVIPYNTNNSVSVYPLSGYSMLTPFQFESSLNSSISGAYYLWNFGDGGISNLSTPTHVYNLPGQYNVTFNAYSSTTNISLSTTVNVYLLLNESLYFSFVPPPAFAGHLNRYPFTLTFTSSVSGPHYIDLAAQFSKSYEAQNPRNKWSFLRPEWRFLDLNGNPITTIVPNEIPIYSTPNGLFTTENNGLFAGVTGSASFYFVDDIYNFDLEFNNQPYTTLIATLRTDEIKSFNDGFNTDYSLPGYANSLATASCPYRILWKNPDTLFVKDLFI